MLAIDTSNRPQLAREFTNSVGVSFPVLLDDQDVSGKLFGVRGTPTTLMIDRAGQIIFRTVGYSPGKEKALAAEVDYLLQSS